VLLSFQSGLAQDGLRAKAEKIFLEGQQARSLDGKIAKYQKALKVDPSFQRAIYQIGVCYFRKGEYQQSIAYLSRIDTIETRHVASYLSTADALHAQQLVEAGDFEAAAAAALKAIEIDSTQSVAYTALGIARLRQNRFGDAIIKLETALKFDPEQENAWINLADALMKKKLFQRAARAYSAALSLDGSSDYARTQLEKAKKRSAVVDWSQQYEDAVEQDSLAMALKILRAAYASQPDSPQIKNLILQAKDQQYYRAGLRALTSSQWQEAVQLLQRVNPAYEDVRIRLEQARSQLALPGSRSETEDLSARSTVPQVRPVPLPATTNSSPDREQAERSLPEDVVIVTKSDSSHTRATINSPRESETRAEKRVVRMRSSPPKTHRKPHWRSYERVDLASALIWSGCFFCAAGIALLFFVLRPRKRITQRPKTSPRLTKKSPAQPSPSELTLTQELFEKELVSETLGFSTETLTPEPQAEDKFEQEQRYDPRLIETKTLTRVSRTKEKIGRYCIEREIGKGSMGMVFKAWDPLLDRTVVIKNVIFAASGRKRSVLRDRLYREASAAGKLNHPNIVTIYDVGEENDFSYIVMEYLQGQTLRSLMDLTDRIDLSRTVALVRQVCMALEFAHRHDIVHRDIKPSNIILTAKDVVKVADFGIAKMPKLETLSRTGDVVGTPFYMSPEQIEGRRLDGRSDIFSTGVLLYEMLTGYRPFEGENVPEIVYKIVHQPFVKPSTKNPDLPTYIDALMERALAKDAHARYQSALELCNVLDEMKEEMVIT